MNNQNERHDCSNCKEEYAVSVKKLASVSEIHSCMYCGFYKIIEGDKVSTHKPFGVLSITGGTGPEAILLSEKLTLEQHKAQIAAWLSAQSNNHLALSLTYLNESTNKLERLTF
ncbi:TPA: hypothetical protein ACGSTL_001265 [Vibrio parahaemolyticus]|uniref:hypothetical protein n=1 Tax=Vibrio campbellii TaxID=680 RepID=UPI001F072E86|nr:hypothetical protein [Vibrio campbellii]UMM06683.1 hypothetical protein MKR81_27430 [Vibrio campbellii]